ncbi:hypothetical protein Patl1_28310 [Pistacia atlantica]|uniref:Uncharacterized protein n=1 Tax=Pistacia atlantica TaxID=434234 RepID=A0ACC1BGN8_9ROSI|nr:hypothetical protein Patl1_28310 [Pistacia atlantica]
MEKGYKEPEDQTALTQAQIDTLNGFKKRETRKLSLPSIKPLMMMGLRRSQMQLPPRKHGRSSTYLTKEKRM